MFSPITDVKFTDKPFACITGKERIMSEVVMVICVPEAVPSTEGNKVDLAMQEGGITITAQYLQKMLVCML